MFLWKEKVVDKLSRLLADSPSSLPRLPPPQEMPSSFEEVSSLKKSPVSSVIHSLLPTNGSEMDRQKSDGPSSPHAAIPSRRGKGSGFSCKDRLLDSNAECGTESESDEAVEMSKENLHYDLERNITASDRIEEASTSVVSGELPAYLTEKSTFVSSDLFEFLQASLPNIVKGCHWVLLYSTVKHGISLRTLLRRSVNLSGPCLLIVGDMQGTIFGGLLDCPLKPTPKRKYQGTNQTFMFTTKYGEPRLFRATGANRYYYLCLNDVLAFGGGGSFALCLDEDLCLYLPEMNWARVPSIILEG